MLIVAVGPARTPRGQKLCHLIVGQSVICSMEKNSKGQISECMLKEIS